MKHVILIRALGVVIIGIVQFRNIFMEKVIFFWFFIDVLAILNRYTNHMAKFTSITFSDISGRIGGTVFRMSGKGGVVYGGVRSRNLKTPRTTRWNQVVSFVSKEWKRRTEAQRFLWDNYWLVSGNGYSRFVKCNLNRYAVTIDPTVTPIVTPVVVTESPRWFIVSASFIANGGKSVTIARQGITTANWRVEIMCTAPVSNGTSSVSSKSYVSMGLGVNVNATTFAFNSAYNSIFGNLTGMSGKVVYVKARLIHFASGIATPYQYIRVVIT